MHGPVLEIARAIVRKVVEELRQKLAREVRPDPLGPAQPPAAQPAQGRFAISTGSARSAPTSSTTIASKKRLVLESLHFSSRVEQHMPWHIIMAVDCSGSMMDSVIYSAVMAGIFKGLPSLRVTLVAFDTAVVDLTDQVDDPDRAAHERATRRRHRHRRGAGLLRDAGAVSPQDHCRAGDRFLRRRAGQSVAGGRSNGCARRACACWAWPLSMRRPSPRTIARWPSSAWPSARRWRP